MTTRRKSFMFDPWFDSLTKAMDIGVLVLGSDCELDFADPRAIELFDCASEEELRARWSGLRAEAGLLLDPPTGVEPHTVGRRQDVDIQLEGGRRRLRLEQYRLDEDECQGSLVVVKDRRSMDALQTDLRLASRFRVLRNVWVGAAHDLKTPLNAMAISADLLRDSLASDNDSDPRAIDRRNRYLDTVREEADRLREMVEKLLRQAAPPKDQPREMDLSERVREMAEMLRPQAQRLGAKLAVHTPEGGVRWTGNFDPIQEAVLNLAVNALEAVEDGGRVEITLERSDHEIAFSVRDDGPGIPNDLLDRIFEMHFTTKDSGTGIGLYVTDQIVQSHGGRILVDTQPGEGACFRITLPAGA